MFALVQRVFVLVHGVLGLRSSFLRLMSVHLVLITPIPRNRKIEIEVHLWIKLDILRWSGVLES